MKSTVLSCLLVAICLFFASQRHPYSFSLQHNHFPGVDISTSLAFANDEFGDYYYGTQQSGAHDFSVTFSLPINLGREMVGPHFPDLQRLFE